jgi:hypothetical protein
MDPTLIAITSAIATGAAAAMKDTASAAVKDAYAAVKRLIQRNYVSVDVTAVEKKPESEAKRTSLQEDLADAGAAEDTELRDLAQALTESLKNDAPDVGPAIGVDLEGVEAEFLRVHSVEAEGTGVKVRKGKFSGGIHIGSVRAGGRASRADEGEGEDDTPNPR